MSQDEPVRLIDSPHCFDFSRLASMPGRQPRKPRARRQEADPAGAGSTAVEPLTVSGTGDPGGLDRPTNVIEILQANFEDYAIKPRGPEVVWIEIVSLPPYIQTTVEKLKAKVFRQGPFTSPRECGLNPALLCCIDVGLDALCHPALDALATARRRFDRESQLATAGEEFVASYFRTGFELDLGSGRKKSIPSSSSIKNRLAGLSVATGLSQTQLAIVCIMAALVLQDEVPQGYRDKMNENLQSVYEFIEMKTVGAEAFMLRLYGARAPEEPKW